MAKKILLIEDDANMVVFVQNLVEKLEYEFECATDGLSGLEKARKVNPDLIILDIMLPKLDGFKISRFLKFDQTYEHIPIIMLTAKSDAKDQKIGETTGADVYITKPFNKQDLIKAINTFLA